MDCHLGGKGNRDTRSSQCRVCGTKSSGTTFVVSGRTHRKEGMWQTIVYIGRLPHPFDVSRDPQHELCSRFLFEMWVCTRGRRPGQDTLGGRTSTILPPRGGGHGK